MSSRLAGESPFLGRTIQVVRDLSVDEQVYLYDRTRRLKEGITAGAAVDAYRVVDRDLSLYLLFMEDSTRTKESFRNAAKFHEIRVNDFDAKNSSFQKKESLTDTVKMLVGYSDRTLFVVRSRIEGTCRWLERALAPYAQRHGLARPAFVNAGDGRHEHPTQEFLDQFSFLEHRRWDRSHIHVALVGDLFHGRTVHSKVNGLRVFNEVTVDLVAPEELAMPDHYVREMVDLGYRVRTFPSLDAYLSRRDLADTWYFTRLQLERMGERLIDRADSLRHAVTVRREFVHRIPEGARFFHPLPRHGEKPTIPSFLDDTHLNGWDEQSRNGYFTRIVEIALITGRLGADLQGESAQPTIFSDDYIVEAPVVPKTKPEYKVGIRPVNAGIVIDHIGRGSAPRQVWDHIDKVRRVLNLNITSSHGVYTSQDGHTHKGIISLPGVLTFDDIQLTTLGAVAPGCTVNIVSDGTVRQKYRLSMPPRIAGIEAIGCRNPDCISHSDHSEGVVPEFHRAGPSRFVCMYCERPHEFSEIWKDSPPRL